MFMKFKIKKTNKKKNKMPKMDPLEELKINKIWDKVFNLMNKLRQEWNKPPLSEKEKKMLKDMFNMWEKSNKNIFLFEEKLKDKEKIIIWIEFLIVINYYSNNY